MRKKLNFSNPFFSAEYIENENSVSITNYGILINLGEKEIEVDKQGSIAKYKSYLLKNYQIKHQIQKAILLSFDFDPVSNNTELNKFCENNWDNNKIRYPEDSSKWDFKILRSSIEKIGNIEFNCWFLPEKTASSIHNAHVFKEVHTQVYGLGIMNKFREQDPETLYQRMYMPPGFTHDFFFDEKGTYPWHQYEAVSSSIWMAICEY